MIEQKFILEGALQQNFALDLSYSETLEQKV
jgi:hypothetical protein